MKRSEQCCSIKGVKNVLETWSKRSKVSDTSSDSSDESHSSFTADEEPVSYWGPYLAERQWGTVREDISCDGTCWESFSHDNAAWRAYRSGEDGLLGVCDCNGLMCTAIALWNGKDPILKERLFGLTNQEGNHGEDVKELYYYLDNNPQHTYMKALYKYPQNEFPYNELVEENVQRGTENMEYELLDTEAFENNAYFDVFVEYANASEQQLICQVTVFNRSSEKKRLVVMPQLWFRNTWSVDESKSQNVKPYLKQSTYKVIAQHAKGRFSIQFSHNPVLPNMLFTNNETRPESRSHGFYKDAFHKYIILGQRDAVNSRQWGTKCGAMYDLEIPAKGNRKIFWCILPDNSSRKLWDTYQVERLFKRCIEETDRFFSRLFPRRWSVEEQNVARQAIAGLLWSKQFYMYDVDATLTEIEFLHVNSEGDNSAAYRNALWRHIQNHEVISVPDKWEFPWYASWDLAFNLMPYMHFDCKFVKYQLDTLLLHRYMKPNGQLPGCEFDLSDTNPPLHAWCCLEVFSADGSWDVNFLRSCFQKLLLNFTWWTGFTEDHSQNTHSGFLGMDNISVLNRSEPPPPGHRLLQADANGWMAYFALNMLKIFLILADHDEYMDFDLAEKFLHIFLDKANQLNRDITGSKPGHWDKQTQFYYDVMLFPEGSHPIKLKSLVGIVPLFACSVIKCPKTEQSKEFYQKLRQSSNVNFVHKLSGDKILLTAVPIAKFTAIFSTLFSEAEFLSPYGIRSLSKVYKDDPYNTSIDFKDLTMQYAPGESNTDMFCGNSNWRGPIWLCMNYMIIQCLGVLHEALGSDFRVHYPTGKMKCTMSSIIKDISRRIISIFLPDHMNARPLHGQEERYAKDPHWRRLLLFYEFFHAETGRGCGASHQTGWTSLIFEFLHKFHHTG